MKCRAGIGSFFRGRRQAPPVGGQTLIGKKAVVRTRLDPTGYVGVQGESWKARLLDGRAEPGETVMVIGVRGLELDVQRSDLEAMPATNKALRVLRRRRS